VLGLATGTWTHSPRPGLGEATTFPLIVYSVTRREGGIQMAILSRDSQDSRVGVPKSRIFGTPATFEASYLSEQISDRLAVSSKVVGLVETFLTVCRTFSAAKYFGSILDFYWSGVKTGKLSGVQTGRLPGVRLPGLLLAITCVSDVQMSNASPFWTSTLQDLSIDIQSATSHGVLTPQNAL
jgi:hypothetical protein